MDNKKSKRKEVFKKASKKRRENLESKGYRSLNTYVEADTKNELEKVQNNQGFNKIGEAIDYIVKERKTISSRA